MPDDESYSTSTASTLSRVDEFVEEQSETRFQLDVPVEILYRDHPPESGSKRQASSDQREQMITEMWERLGSLWAKDGYRGLRDMKRELESRKDEEQDNRRSLSREVACLEKYQTLLEINNAAANPRPMREVFPSSCDREATGLIATQCSLEWIQDPLNDPKGESVHGQGYIAPHELGNPSTCANALTFGPHETTGEIWDELRDEVSERKLELKDQRLLCRLIDFRLTLLKRFLWTRETAGGTPENPTVSSVSQRREYTDTGARHACTVLKLLPYLPGEHLADTTEADLKRCISEQLNQAETRVQPQSVAKGAARFLKKALHYYDNESIDAKFWELLKKHRGDLERVEKERDLDVPTPSTGREDGNTTR